MNHSLFTLAERRTLAPSVTLWRLSGETSSVTRPGQFVNVSLDGFFLRRPISVCDWDDGSLTLIFKTVGNGTAAMERMQPGITLDLLTNLGNGYDLARSGEHPLLIGGGAGVPPLYGLAKELRKQGKRVTVLLGFNKKEEVFFESEFRGLGADVLVSTADGSYGVPGFVTDSMKRVSEYSFTYACGPLPMLRAVYDASPVPGEFSFEERMGCGFGACMGCTVLTKNGPKRICRDGPVLEKEEILW